MLEETPGFSVCAVPASSWGPMTSAGAATINHPPIISSVLEIYREPPPAILSHVCPMKLKVGTMWEIPLWIPHGHMLIDEAQRETRAKSARAPEGEGRGGGRVAAWAARTILPTEILRD